MIDLRVFKPVHLASRGGILPGLVGLGGIARHVGAHKFGWCCDQLVGSK